MKTHRIISRTSVQAGGRDWVIVRASVVAPAPVWRREVTELYLVDEDGLEMFVRYLDRGDP